MSAFAGRVAAFLHALGERKPHEQGARRRHRPASLNGRHASRP